MTETQSRVRKNILGRRPQTVSKEIIDLFNNKEKYDMRPVYQRDIRWSQNLMNNLIGTIMDNGLVPSLIVYKLTKNDKAEKNTTKSYEVVDGQHRLFTIFNFMSSEYVELPRKKKFMIYWPYKNEAGIVCPVFYQQTDATIEWFSKNPRFEPRYFTDDEKEYFNEFCFDIREIDFQLTVEQRRQIFMSLQNGVQVKNSDWLKNKTECGLIRFMSEHNYEDKMKNPDTGILAFSYRKPDNYWIQWVCRFYTLFLTTNMLKNNDNFVFNFDKTSIRCFTLSDTDYKNKCNSTDPSFNDEEKILKFNIMFEKFHQFLNGEHCINMKFNPTQLFVLFQYLCLHSDTIDKIDACHIKVFYNTGKDKFYRSMWENMMSNIRGEYYIQCLNELASLVDTCDSDIFTSKITPELKNKVWRHHYGDTNNANCPCGEIIYVDNHHCGHIKARAKGGKTCVENLKPICASCNLKMGTKNMDEYFEDIACVVEQN